MSPMVGCSWNLSQAVNQKAEKIEGSEIWCHQMYLKVQALQKCENQALFKVRSITNKSCGLGESLHP